VLISFHARFSIFPLFATGAFFYKCAAIAFGGIF
jgi:hypothetical protein